MDSLIAIRKELDLEIHRIRLETDVYYVLGKMGERFRIWRPFFYRGYVFLCGKQYHVPDQEDSLPYDYRVRMFAGKRSEFPQYTNESYQICKGIRASTDDLGKEFGIDFDRCDLEDLIPLITHLMEKCEMGSGEYGWETFPKYEFMDDIYKIIDERTATG